MLHVQNPNTVIHFCKGAVANEILMVILCVALRCTLYACILMCIFCCVCFRIHSGVPGSDDNRFNSGFAVHHSFFIGTEVH